MLTAGSCGQMFQNLLDEVSSSSLMNRKQEVGPPPPYAHSLPPSDSIKLADGGASFHSVNQDMSRHESGGTTGAGGEFTCQYSL